MPHHEEHRLGTYKEPFTHTEIGAFVTKADGSVSFIAVGVSARDAFLRVEEYYRRMNEHPQNDMDMTDLDRISYRQRPVTYGLWEEYSGDLPQDSDAI